MLPSRMSLIFRHFSVEATRIRDVDKLGIPFCRWKRCNWKSDLRFAGEIWQLDCTFVF